MSDEVLSKEEIDLLMQTLEKKKEEAKGGIKPFDWDALEKIEPERYVRLEQFSSDLALWLGEIIQRKVYEPIDVSLKSKKRNALSRVITALSPPFLLSRISTTKAGEVYLILDAKSAYTLISLLLGGAPAETEGKPFSRLELNLLSRVLGEVCQKLIKEWNEFFSVKLKDCEITQNVYELDLDDEHYIAQYTLTTPTTKTPVLFAVPVFLLKEMKHELTLSRPSPEDAKAMLSALMNVPLTLECVIEKRKDKLSSALLLEREATLITEKKLTDDVSLTLEGKEKFLGQLGEVDGRRAVKISRVL
ncbi:MAG: hypothetical protein GXO04_02495 [Aquificae bacterium]|nr:hypothetical protein [Aquificota bacterium]